MNIKNMKLPIIIIVIGLIIAAISSFFTCIVQEPVIKAHDFDYSITYNLDGEEKTLNGVFRCTFTGNDVYDISTVRLYDGKHTQNGVELHDHSLMVAQKDGNELYLVIMLDEDYLMGDPDIYEIENRNEDPYFYAYDSEGMGIDAYEVFNAEIISWDYPEPIKNSFKFTGFSFLHSGSMLAMSLVGVLTIIACAIFIKKDSGIEYKTLDKISTVLNFIIGLIGVPFVAFLIWIMQIVASTEEFMYQMYLCIPAMTLFAIAASVVLRRKGFSKSGLIAQFVFPVLFFLQLIVESLIYNLFL